MKFVINRREFMFALFFGSVVFNLQVWVCGSQRTATPTCGLKQLRLI